MFSDLQLEGDILTSELPNVVTNSGVIPRRKQNACRTFLQKSFVRQAFLFVNLKSVILFIYE